MAQIVLQGRGVTNGQAEGRALVCPHGMTGWGGVDPKTGVITDIESEHFGQCIRGAILVIPGSRGSNGWSCFFTATHMAGNGPKALVAYQVDASVGVALACMNIPAVVDCEADPCSLFADGDLLRVDGATGVITKLE